MLGLLQSLECPFSQWGKVSIDKGPFSWWAFQSAKLVDGKAGDQSQLAMPGTRPVPLPCRLEEQTRKLQKDLKKSTDADLGKWHVLRAGLGGAQVNALLPQSP